jgi:hypothetical protein
MKQIKATFYSVFLALFVSGNASASDNSNVVISNMEGLVVKNFSCDTIYDILDFNVSNRNNSSVDGDLTITMFDSDNDPINSFTISIKIEPVSGVAISHHTRCEYATSYAARVAM